jgi:hypothetical protein
VDGSRKTVWVEDLDGDPPIAVGQVVRWHLHAATPLDRDFVGRVLGTPAADLITDTYGSMGEYRPGRWRIRAMTFGAQWGLN